MCFLVCLFLWEEDFTTIFDIWVLNLRSSFPTRFFNSCFRQQFWSVESFGIRIIIYNVGLLSLSFILIGLLHLKTLQLVLVEFSWFNCLNYFKMVLHRIIFCKYFWQDVFFQVLLWCWWFNFFVRRRCFGGRRRSFCKSKLLVLKIFERDFSIEVLIDRYSVIIHHVSNVCISFKGRGMGGAHVALIIDNWSSGLGFFRRWENFSRIVRNIHL